MQLQTTAGQDTRSDITPIQYPLVWITHVQPTNMSHASMNEPLLQQSETPVLRSLKYRRVMVFTLTFLSYTCFHLSRKPASILKSVLHPTHDYDREMNPGWAPFNRDVVPDLVASEGYVVQDAGLYSGTYKCATFKDDGACLVFRLTKNADASLFLTPPGTDGDDHHVNICQDSWVITPVDASAAKHVGENYYFAQEFDGREIPEATLEHRGKWNKCEIGTCNCTVDDKVAVNPDTLSGNLLLGEVDTVFLGFYSAGLFVSGHFGDYLDLRHFLVFGMIGSGVCSVALGLAHAMEVHSMAYFLFWNALGGLFQSIGWPCVVSIMSHWFGKETRGFVMGVWSSHASVGNILGSVITSASLSLGMHGKDWPLGFIVPGVVIIAMAIVVFILLDPAPPFPIDQEVPIVVAPTEGDELGTDEGNAQTLEENDQIDVQEESNGEQDSTHVRIEAGFIRALMIPGVVNYSICLAFCKLTVYSLMYWGPFYLAHVGFTSENAGFMSSFYDIGGIVGGILAGYVSDRLQLRACVALGFLALSVPTIWFYYAVTTAVGPNVGVNMFVMVVVGTIVSAPYTLITTAVSADLGSHPSLKGNTQLFSSVSGIIDGTGSVGAMVQGVLIGYISTSSWKNVYQFLMVSNTVAALLIVGAAVSELRSR